MKKIVTTLLLAICFIASTAQTTLHATSTNIGKTVNQPYTNTLVKQLNNGYEVRKMRLPLTDTVADYVVQKIGHDYIMDGDIVVGNDLPKTQSFTLKRDDSKWPNASIPIEIDKSIYFNNMDQAVFNAIDSINEKLGLQVVIRKSEDDYVKIIGIDSSLMGFAAGYSSVGVVGGEQWLGLNIQGGAGLKTILHEMLHAAGAYHEMNRPDRDQFLVVNWENIKEEAGGQFENTISGMANGVFDFCSVMLYSQNSSAGINAQVNTWDRVDKQKNIIPLPGCTNKSNTYSDLDKQGIDKLYGISQFPSQIKIHRGSGQRMMADGTAGLKSALNNYSVIYDQDGSLTIIRSRDKVAIWSSSTRGKAPGVCVMQADGNLVMYGPSGDAYWSTGTNGNWGSNLILQNNGNLIINNRQGKQIWASNSIDNAVLKVPLEKGNELNCILKWKSDVGMPSTEVVSEWLRIRSVGASAFEDNNYYTTRYKNFTGRFTDYVNLGKISTGIIRTEGEYKILDIKITDLPLAAPYEFNLELNPAVQWSGQSTKPSAALQSYSVGLQMGMTFGKGIDLSKTPKTDYVEAEIKGYWSNMSVRNVQTDSKILQPKPGSPVANPVIKTTPVFKNVIKQ